MICLKRASTQIDEAVMPRSFARAKCLSESRRWAEISNVMTDSDEIAKAAFTWHPSDVDKENTYEISATSLEGRPGNLRTAPAEAGVRS